MAIKKYFVIAAILVIALVVLKFEKFLTPVSLVETTATVPAHTPVVIVNSSTAAGSATGSKAKPATESSTTPIQKTQPANVTEPKKPAPTGFTWGVYTGNAAGSLGTFENLVGGTANIQAIFLSMGLDSFPMRYRSTIGISGKTLLIFWEPDDGTSNVDQPDFNYAAILGGNYDANIKEFAAAAKAYGYPVILVPMDEMNSDWTPWGGTVNGNTPDQFAKVWIHIHDFFADDPNVKFGWDPNNVSSPNTPANAMSAYWPGPQYVDYVGVDGFNGNGDPWQSFSQIFPQSLMDDLASYGKPVYIFSMGSTENSSDPLAKAMWIAEGIGPDGAISAFPNFAGWVWFNENGGTNSNWLVNSDPAALDAFRAAVKPQ